MYQKNVCRLVFLKLWLVWTLKTSLVEKSMPKSIYIPIHFGAQWVMKTMVKVQMVMLDVDNYFQ